MSEADPTVARAEDRRKMTHDGHPGCRMTLITGARLMREM